MIIVTGAAGFIGSCIVKGLNDAGRHDIIAVDREDAFKKTDYLSHYHLKECVSRDVFLEKLESGAFSPVDAIIHMGASTSTTDTDREGLMQNNLEYSKRLFEWCVKNNSRLIYASSAATYGDGTQGYSDDTTLLKNLKPLNYYGESKHLFDQYMLSSKKKPRQWVGLKFFNVYGPNEYHKGQMASVAFHAFNQIKKTGKMRLFRSYRKGYADGEQKRDFVYVKDVVSVVLFFLEHPDKNGIFNVGTGKARTYNDLALAVFAGMRKPAAIEYFDMPEHLKAKYQYFTEADISSLRACGYTKEFFSLEEGVKDYVDHHLEKSFSCY